MSCLFSSRLLWIPAEELHFPLYQANVLLSVTCCFSSSDVFQYSDMSPSKCCSDCCQSNCSISANSVVLSVVLGFFVTSLTITEMLSLVRIIEYISLVITLIRCFYTYMLLIFVELQSIFLISQHRSCFVSYPRSILNYLSSHTVYIQYYYHC